MNYNERRTSQNHPTLVEYDLLLEASGYQPLDPGPNVKDVIGYGVSAVDLSLDYIDLSNNKTLVNGNWQGSSLDKANFQSSLLASSNFSHACLREVNFSNAQLRWSNFTGACMTGVNLEGADLRYCTGNGKEIKSLAIDDWSIVYTHDMLYIGCKMYPIQQWWDFSDDEIQMMDVLANSLGWWKKNKECLRLVIDTFPAYNEH